MDRKGGMTQVPSSGFRWGKAAMGAAIIALGFAIGSAVNRDSGAAPAAAPQMAATSMSGDPVAALEKRTKDNPKDGEAWAGLGAAYFNAGRFSDAIPAYEKATAVLPNAAGLWSALGESRVMASERDPMPAEAAANFAKAASLDAKDPRARYFLAVKKDLALDHRGAIEDWLALLANTPPGAPWEADLRRTIEQVAKINSLDVSTRLAATQQPAPTIPVAARGIPGPSAQDLQAAGAIPPSEQRQMAEGMVSRLDARLKADPKNADGWIMLMRSRMTLGQPDKASQALKDAIAANPAEAEMLRQQAGILGVK
jgi:cytochrome c-type biogenesis protein CcmH